MREVEWNDACERAFQELELKLTTVPSLSYTKKWREVFHYSDASHSGLGCVLMQEDQVSAYASRQKN